MQDSRLDEVSNLAPFIMKFTVFVKRNAALWELWEQVELQKKVELWEQVEQLELREVQPDIWPCNWLVQLLADFLETLPSWHATTYN